MVKDCPLYYIQNFSNNVSIEASFKMFYTIAIFCVYLLVDVRSECDDEIMLLEISWERKIK